jgi:hypothetical protein
MAWGPIPRNSDNIEESVPTFLYVFLIVQVVVSSLDDNDELEELASQDVNM